MIFRCGGPSPVPSWPLPRPLPRREGRDHRDTPIRRMKASFCSLLLSTIAITFCVLCMPEAFCELKTCAKNLRDLRALCERKNYPATLKHTFSHGGCVLFLTEKHRRTDFTKVHRDIKSTDFTEPYTHL